MALINILMVNKRMLLISLECSVFKQPLIVSLMKWPMEPLIERLDQYNSIMRLTSLGMDQSLKLLLLETNYLTKIFYYRMELMKDKKDSKNLSKIKSKFYLISFSRWKSLDQQLLDQLQSLLLVWLLLEHQDHKLLYALTVQQMLAWEPLMR